MRNEKGISTPLLFIVIFCIVLCLLSLVFVFLFCSQIQVTDEEIPEPLRTYFMKAGEMFVVPSRLLAGIYAGEHNMGFPISGPWGGGPYLGPLQFDSASWQRWGYDGNFDGAKDANDPCDAIYGLANRCKNSWKITMRSSDYDLIMSILAHRGYGRRASLPKSTNRTNYSDNLKKYVFGGTIGDDVTLKVIDFVFSEGTAIGSVVQVASKEIGINEADSSYLKYGERGPWCAAFVCWCYKQAGKNIPGGSHYCPTLRSQVGLVSDPIPGDIIFFGSGPSHVGIVEKVSSSTIYTIEGNSEDKVARRSYNRGSYYIHSFGRYP